MTARLPILVQRSTYECADESCMVDALVDGYVNPLIMRGYYLESELPLNAMRGYHASYYGEQVCNGGHGLFMHNSRMDPLVMKDVRECLTAIGARTFVEIFNLFERLVKLDPIKAADIAAQAGFSAHDSPERSLNERFHTAGYKDLFRLPLGRWLRRLPELEVVADAEFDNAIEGLISANPFAGRRKTFFERQRLASTMQYLELTAAWLLAAKVGITSLRLAGVDTEAKTPDGQPMTGWIIKASEKTFTMFQLDDAVILCDKARTAGRELSRDSLSEAMALVASGTPLADAIKSLGFGGWFWTEIARIPNALVDEALAATKDGTAFAAAELVCAEFDDKLVEIHASSKSITQERGGTWSYALSGNRGHYSMWMSAEGAEGCCVINDIADETTRRRIDAARIVAHRIRSGGGHSLDDKPPGASAASGLI